MIGIVLERLSIPFVPRHQIRVVGFRRPLECDFYLPDYLLIIEVDGEQHYGPRKFGGNEARALQEFARTKLRDRAKRDALLKAGIRTTRIPFWVSNINKEIENILSGKPTFPDVPSLILPAH